MDKVAGKRDLGSFLALQFQDVSREAGSRARAGRVSCDGLSGGAFFRPDFFCVFLSKFHDMDYIL
jgi:hypothetical protein